MRTCDTCGVDASEDHPFINNSANASVRRCKECEALRQKQYQEKRNANSRKWRKDQREKVNAYNREYQRRKKGEL